MNFSIKPPLYALDSNQINDFVYAQDIHLNIIIWLKQIKHFPIITNDTDNYNSGLLLFERFTPWFDNWCKNYSLKIYEFYKHISNSFFYNNPYFNGYGLLDIDYGDQLNTEPAYSFNIPPSITLVNPTDKLITITYLEKSYKESNIFFDKVSGDLELYVKRIIRLPSKESVELSTDTILFCSCKLNALDNLTPNDIGIPLQLDYTKIDDYLEEIKNIIDNNFPYLNKKIKQIDYNLNMLSGGQYDQSTGNLSVYLDYQLNYVPNTLILQNVPSWYYAACLIYGNNDYWESGEPINDDVGKELNVRVFSNWLEYDFLDIPNRPLISSNFIVKPIFPEGIEPPLIYYPSFLYFTYQAKIGIYGLAIDESSTNNLYYSDDFTYRNSINHINYGIPSEPGFSRYKYIFSYFAYNGYTNTGIANLINPYLFISVNGMVSAYNSLIVESSSSTDNSDPNNTITNLTSKHGISRFVFDVSYDTPSNVVTLNSDVDEQFIAASFVTQLNQDDLSTIYDDPPVEFGINLRVGTAGSSGSLSGVVDKDNNDSNANFEITKTLIFSTHLSDPRTIRSNTDQEIIDFVDSIIIPNHDNEEFMPDSLRIIEIHEALNAGKFANDPNDSEVFRFANLGYYIERIARVLGISVDPDGSIRSVRQRAHVESGETIPVGWLVGQWGRNQGGSSEGQLGGNVEDDKDGITYPVISNKFTVDQFTGKPDKIVDGGYVLCENIIQYLETFKDDLDKALGLQYAGANSYPRPQGDGDVSYEGLSTLIQENTYMISQLSRLISSAQISSLVTQAIVSELLAHCGVPTTIKELNVNVGEGQQVSVPYPAITENSPSQFDQTLWLLSNLAPLLGGKINIRQDQRLEDDQ